MNFPKSFVMRDFYEIAPSAQLTSMSKRDKVRFMDNVLNDADTQRRGLRVDFDISHGGRRINNRIYPPVGQAAGVSTWINAPVIRHHKDADTDPIGRIFDVKHVNIEDEALRFFTTYKDFMEVKTALDSNDPKRIYSALKKHKLLTNPAWTGMSKLSASARISDEDAIEKFIDGRYLTFSAGTTTNRYACGICGHDWMQDGSPCEHTPGAITEDQEIGTIITGDFNGREVSVVNIPADKFALVRNLEFLDAQHYTAYYNTDAFQVDANSIYLADASVIFTGDDMLKKNQTEENVADAQQPTEAAVEQPVEQPVEQTAEQQVAQDAQVAETPAEEVAAPAVVESQNTLSDFDALLDRKFAEFYEKTIQHALGLSGAQKSEDSEQLQRDYASALQTVEALEASMQEFREKLDQVLDAHARLRQVDFADLELDSKWESFCKMQENASQSSAEDQAKPLATIENPTEAAAAPSAVIKDLDSTLSDFEKKTVREYKEIRDAHGNVAAERYLLRARPYLKRGFHPNNFS